MRTWKGQRPEIPMFKTCTNFMLFEHLAGLAFDPPNAPVGYFRQIDPDRQPFPTSDGSISIVPYTDEAWPRVFDLLANPQFMADARFATRKGRTVNLPLLYLEVTRLPPAFPPTQLVSKCHPVQCRSAAVRDTGDIM